MDDIKRTTAPQTTNGTQWEVQLSGSPPREWLDLFKLSGESSSIAVPNRVVFDRAAAYFKSDEEHVEHWIQSIDKWIASTNARYTTSIEQASRERPRAKTPRRGRRSGSGCSTSASRTCSRPRPRLRSGGHSTSARRRRCRWARSKINELVGFLHPVMSIPGLAAH